MPLSLAPTNRKDVRTDALEWQITHQFVILFVVDTRLLVCVADSFQECCFTGVGTADHKNAKLTVFLSNFSVVAHVDGGTWKRVSGRLSIIIHRLSLKSTRSSSAFIPASFSHSFATWSNGTFLKKSGCARSVNSDLFT